MRQIETSVRAALCAGAATALLASAVPAAAEEEAADAVDAPVIVVSATRSGDGIDQRLIGSSVTVLDPQQIAERETRIVSDVLRDVPGVAVSRTGAIGGQTQIRIRGTEANQTLVLIDGIEASDAYAGEFDWATLIADDAARIEVLRGQQSALYGSDAIGGVVSYTTLSGREAPGIRLRVEGGSFGTYDGSARIAGTAGDQFDYALSGSLYHTDGYPTALYHSVSEGPGYDGPAAPGIRDIGSESLGLSAKANWTPIAGFRLSSVLRYGHTSADLSDSSPWGGPALVGAVPVIGTVDSDGVRYTDRSWSGLVRAELDSFGGAMTTAGSAQFSHNRRDTFDPFPYAYSDYYGDRGTRYRGSLENTLRFGNDRMKHAVTIALDAEREEYLDPGFGTILSDRHDLNALGVAGQYTLALDDRLGIGASLRYDSNDRFRDAATWHVDASYLFPGGTRLHAAAGKGIKNPTATELFGYYPPFIGNPQLVPERSVGWEAGVDQTVAGGAVTLGATYFHSRLTNWIRSCSLGGTASVCNDGPVTHQQGVELYGQARLGDVRIDLGWTWLDAPQTNTAVLDPNVTVTGYGAGPSFGDPIPVGYDFYTPGLIGAVTAQAVRRPKYSGSANLTWAPEGGPLSATLTLRYNGRMKDYAFDTYYNYLIVDLKSFALVGLAARYRVTDAIEVYARAENLLDEHYQEVFTFRAPGREIFAGARLRF